MPEDRDEDTSPALPVATVGQGAAPMEPALARLAAVARAYAAAKDSANTARAYASDCACSHAGAAGTASM